jgi:hypothetical protein
MKPAHALRARLRAGTLRVTILEVIFSCELAVQCSRQKMHGFEARLSRAMAATFTVVE